MAQILQTYNAKPADAVISGGRRAEGSDFAPDLSPVAASLKHSATELQSNMEEDEGRKAMVAASEIRAKYAKALDDAALSGAPLEPIREAMHNELAATGENFQTRKGAQSVAIYTANADLMFDEQANHINVSRASADAKVQGAAMLRSESTLVQSNPSYLKTAEDNVSAFIETYKGKVRPEVLAEMADNWRKELNVSSALSEMRRDPKGATARVEAGEWDLSATQRDSLIGKGKEEIRAQHAEDEIQYALKHRALEEANQAGYSDHLKNILAGKDSRRAILDDTRLKPNMQEHLVEMMEQRAKNLTSGENKSDPITKKNLWLAAMTGGTYDNTPVIDAVRSGKLNLSDASQLSGIIANQKDENNRSIGSRIGSMTSIVGRSLSQDPRYIGRPELVAEIQNDYVARVNEKISSLRTAKTDPAEVFDPKSKNYIGSKEFVQESINNATATHRAAMPQAVKVNSQAEYDALEPNTPYIDSNGNSGTKKGAAKKADLGPDYGFGKRADGTNKGKGYFGVMRTANGNAISEYSVGVEIDGKEVDVPSLVPTLTNAEVQSVIQAADKDQPPPDTVIKKAEAFARKRIKEGKSPFAGKNDQIIDAYTRKTAH